MEFRNNFASLNYFFSLALVRKQPQREQRHLFVTLNGHGAVFTSRANGKVFTFVLGGN